MKFMVLLVCVGVAMAHNPYIIRGDDVRVAGKYPHQGSLRVHGHHSCGLSLISSTWAITAAHCVSAKSVSSLTARFGTNDRLSGGQIVNVRHYKTHELYENWRNDIAVVQFREAVDITFGSNASPIRMADGTTDPEGNDDCWITGWGYTIYGDPLPKILQEAKIKVYTQEQCKKELGNDIDESQVCIGDKVNKRVACRGDSGGPLICKVNGRYELFGAGSWGTYYCSASSFTVYSRVSYFRQWIKDNSGV